MNRSQSLFNLLKNQSQVLFWKYTAASQPLASPIAVLAYKSSFLEFLEYAAAQHHLKKITQVRKRHVTCYMDYLKRNRGTDYMIAKRVYAICFWLRMIEENPERFPTFDSFGLEYCPKTEFVPNLTGVRGTK